MRVSAGILFAVALITFMHAFLLGNFQPTRVFVVAYTTRTHAIRIISARKANQREVTRYENHTFDD